LGDFFSGKCANAPTAFRIAATMVKIVTKSRFHDAFREAGSFVAGFFGLSIVVAVFAMIVASPSNG